MQSKFNLKTFEFILIFLGPLFLISLGVIPKNPIPILIIGGAIMFIFLRKDPEFDNSFLFNFSALKAAAPIILFRFVIAGVGLSLLAYSLDPNKFLDFLKQKPEIWIIVMFAYPVFSAYPQEVIYRAFFFHRYRELFDSDIGLIIASSALFGIAHIILGNWFAVALSTIGGALFCLTYLKSKSLLAASFEHALYGDLIFTLGLGRYFYHGYHG